MSSMRTGWRDVVVAGMVIALVWTEGRTAFASRSIEGSEAAAAFAIVTDASGDGWWTVHGSEAPRVVPVRGGRIAEDVTRNADDPAAAIRQLFAAYALRDPDLCGAILTEDFRFTSDDPAFAQAWPSGMTREDERRFIEHLANGRVTKDGRVLPPVNGIAIAVGSFEVALAGDGSSARVVAHDVRSRMTTANGMLMESDEDLTFELVRSVPGRKAHARPLAIGSWRVRRWDERVAPEAAGTEPTASAESAAATGPSSVRLALHRVSGPREWPVRLEIASPRGAEPRLEVFDVAGRMIVDRLVHPDGSSVARFTLDDRAITAGVYFARARAAGQTVTSKLVVLR